MENPNLTKSTWTRKCDCPFRLRGTRSSVGDGWYLHVICGLHNHELAKKLTGHSFLGRLSQDEKNVLGDMTKNFEKPKNILMTLRDHNVESLTTIKQVYNARQAYRSSLRGSRTKMQHLLTLMERDKYVYRYRKVEGSDELRDIFWTHPEAITLVNNFHIILIMDSTYKTCRYQMSLLEIIGVTSSEMTFCVGFAYLQSERVDNFTWSLQMVKEHITSGEVEVIVTDRDLALMNAVENVFPKAVNLLCLFHICKNVKAKFKMTVFPKKKQVQIIKAWETLIYSYDEDQYYMKLDIVEGICSSCSIFYDYVHEQLLIPHKESFVEA
ncbi:protein FAR-RED IMPAIRED RESPONSE 1-like [Cicer arietinum]|uniref:protein FAR-RED IMPAIRED RESPONSE 1-like n=1 Tax=Cicer arietinum TaxID=3827 RepID=UPI003CC53280